MSEITKQSPIMEKTVAILNMLDDLNIIIDDLTVKLTSYLLPETVGKNDGSGTIKEAEAPISPLEEYLIRCWNKIDDLRIKIKQIDSRIR